MPSFCIHEIEQTCTNCCNYVGCKREGGKAIPYKDDRNSQFVIKKSFGEELDNISTSVTQFGQW